MDYKKYIASKIKAEGVSEDEIYSSIALPPNTEMGDYALPCFRFAKVMRKSPALIAQAIAAEYPADDVIERAEAVNGYVNFTVNKAALARETIDEALERGALYGSSNEGSGKTVCIDYSSVNIAKPFHIGHLSTTAIGSALYKIFNFLGYKAVGINHLGDYGTQFGKLICAYKHWGNKDEVEKGGIHAINDLYVRFNSEADEEMEREAREYFRLIESGDKEANELFDWFKALTLKYVKTIYEKLNVKFDSYAGERFYTDKMEPVIDELRKKGLLKESEGAQIVDLEQYGMPPCLILRSDGASLYATRDLAAAIYRKNTYDFYKCLYVVAYQQNLHFKQVFKVLELMGREWAKDLVHVAYGMVSLEDGAMSTRKGKVVWLEDVISRCVEKAYGIISEKNPDLENKGDVAEKVGVGAVIFGALYNSKIKDARKLGHRKGRRARGIQSGRTSAAGGGGGKGNFRIPPGREGRGRKVRAQHSRPLCRRPRAEVQQILLRLQNTHRRRRQKGLPPCAHGGGAHRAQKRARPARHRRTRKDVKGVTNFSYSVRLHISYAILCRCYGSAQSLTSK